MLGLCLREAVRGLGGSANGVRQAHCLRQVGCDLFGPFVAVNGDTVVVGAFTAGPNGADLRVRETGWGLGRAT